MQAKEDMGMQVFFFIQQKAQLIKMGNDEGEFSKKKLKYGYNNTTRTNNKCRENVEEERLQGERNKNSLFLAERWYAPTT